MSSTTKGNQKSVLGRGLSALLQDSVTQTEVIAAGNFFRMIPVKSISVNPAQPRKDFSPALLQELAESIKAHGIIQPLTVRKIDGDCYQLITGERRLRAAKLVELKEVPVYIRTTDDQHMLELALIENIQRAALNAIEIALSYQRLLIECKLTQDTLAKRVGKDRTTVNNYLRLLKLPPDVQIALRDQKISMGHARALINLKSPEIQLSLLRKIIAFSLSVREIEQRVQALSVGGNVPKTAHKSALNALFRGKLKTTATHLTEHFNTKISIKVDGCSQGEIRIMFNSEDEFTRIVSMISER